MVMQPPIVQNTPQGQETNSNHTLPSEEIRESAVWMERSTEKKMYIGLGFFLAILEFYMLFLAFNEGFTLSKDEDYVRFTLLASALITVCFVTLIVLAVIRLPIENEE